MEVVAATPGTGGVPPFHDHDVREWSRLDSLTGVLERARLETDHWTANTNNSCHKYGKVVDSRARTNADGALQQQARRQLEVFQSHIPGGHLQVIKTQSVSSSRWSNKSTDLHLPIKDFENLQLSLNPLDLTSQKSKANVGRSVGRRPPSRPRARDESLNLYRVSRLCHQIHEETLKQNEHPNLTRTKSTSSEDLHLEDKSSKSIEDLEDLEQLQSWRRTSKLRRSLQYPKENKPAPKPVDLPENSGSVRKIREELEKGRRLSTALRGNSVDLQALDQILQTISSSSSDKPEDSQDEAETKKQKRNSFVTVETLQEVRGRLRRTSSSTEDIYKTNKDEETDDGIVTECNEMPVSEKSRVRSYVYGMEATKKPILGTGSLESRTKLLNGGTNLRNEDWYNRRKSYGFEQVHNHNETSNPISLKNRGRVESSTDSGICRSSEIVIVPATKSEEKFTSVKQISSIFDNKDLKSTTITIPIVSKPNSNFVDLSWDDVPEKEVKRHSIAVDEPKYDNKFRRAIDDSSAQNRKSKKVEFCKTEVHFAAESGKVNIVETDEKPPPTNNFRRRRRNSGPVITDDFNGLPVLHFGDSSYEKILLGVADEDFEPATDENIYSNISCGTVTVNTTSNLADPQDDDKKDAVENVKGILKNKPIKPTPYHLGEDRFLNSNSDSDSGKWGVRLKPVQKTEPPYWKSTVTLHNTVFGQDEQPEFQKLLRNLRPTSGNKPDLVANQRNSENFSSVKFVTSADNRRPWSVADRVKLSEDGQWAENKVYSTKVNFGDGGTAVVENDQFEQKEWNKKENSAKDDLKASAKHKFGIEDSLSKTYRIKTKDKYSPVATRKLKSATSDLSSPSLVGRSSKLDLRTDKYEYKTESKEFANVTDAKLHQKHSSNDIVLRQPKRSEMTYFGVRVSPQSVKKSQESVIHRETKLSEKPDLLQHMKTDSPKSRTRSPERTQPIYENVVRVGKEFDSNILEELTKAADQILLAVNGFTDDDSHENTFKEPLATITESKSWSQDKKSKTAKQSNVKTRLKHTSSTSSVESLTKGRKAQQIRPVPIRKKNVVNEPTVRATTKARRLQRASSREALLQSHGSSSEDLGANVEIPQRKPRQIRKTKQTQLTVSNGIEMNKKTTPPNPPRRRAKTDEKVEPVTEIRHKTAVSTIRSTADKSSRDRSRSRAEEAKKRVPPTTKKEPIKGTIYKSEPKKAASTREISNHRISTANIKKCHRTDEKPRHSELLKG
nr:PREDICTED: uncharacterized protein LOC656219 isoform X5 [Tribolium castaneum]|eukprot:XP_015840216.1 PREDICTED: uncharacterized protein LOC656219 isoform X5 [Tribolium castaneum]